MRTTYTRTLTHEAGLLVYLNGDEKLTRIEPGTQLTLTHDTWKPSESPDEMTVLIELPSGRTALEFFLPSEIVRIFDPDRSDWK